MSYLTVTSPPAVSASRFSGPLVLSLSASSRTLRLGAPGRSESCSTASRYREGLLLYEAGCHSAKQLQSCDSGALSSSHVTQELQAAPVM
ncbi:hypothetical protein EYF80_050128 [Liparis tanakae]|uniref:Uncharacterized protein n=1 Tax=Liparis tanakae TaxID=230148 RepID=A0A4Z2FG09_9TELE|nr:hypothetical protein EYF80_050128 [Liparis tanakae]